MKKVVFIGKIGIGGNHPVSLQSMTTTPTEDTAATLHQIHGLKEAGCDIVRVSVPHEASLPAFKSICSTSPLPVIADIHFHYRLAVQSMESGAAAIRINPGNIGSKNKIQRILDAAKSHHTPIRIGVNWGSIDHDRINRNLSKGENMVNQALEYIRMFEKEGFDLIKVSLKSSSLTDTIEAYTLMDRRSDYPLHLGITEAGPLLPGTVKSSIGIGGLLLRGIGNTIRVSLTADPVEEIRVGREILKATGHARPGDIEIISCPTCARTVPGFLPMVQKLEKKLLLLSPASRCRVAIMGCEVNGPGEAKEADIGIAFSRNKGVIFRDSKIIDRVEPANAVEKLTDYIQKFFC